MFEVVQSSHKWQSNTELESKLIYKGEVIATAVVNVLEGKIGMLSGGFNAIPENLPLYKQLNTTHIDHWTKVLKDLAMRFATRDMNLD